MATPLHIVASCADRKRLESGTPVRLRDFEQRNPDKRMAKWWGSLEDKGTRVAAEDLYAGPYWATVRSLQQTRASDTFDISLWVASAGYGLVPASAPLRAYSATFRSNERDSVVRDSDRACGFRENDWWTALAGQRVAGVSAPRTIARLAKKNPRARIVVIGSTSYVTALESDLLAALCVLRDPDQLMIVCGSPGPSANELQNCWIASEARLLARVGGSLPALHARVARQILNESPRYGLDASAIKKRWATIRNRSPEMSAPQRLVSTDVEVKKFIADSLQRDPKAKHTRLLRDFRASGRACEQNRFRDLFREATGTKA